MKRLALLLLLAVPAVGQITDLESCQQRGCYGFRQPTGQSQNGMIWQDLSVSPPRLYCGYNQGWQLCGSSSGLANLLAAPQYRLFIQPNTGTQAVAGPAVVGVDAVAPSINSVRNASQYCTTPGTLDQTCINNAMSANTTISLTPGTYNFNTTINVTQNNVTLTCTAGAVMYNNQTASPAPMFNITGANFTISPGCVLDNGNVNIIYTGVPNTYGIGVITAGNQGFPQVFNLTLNGITMLNCNTAPCIAAFNTVGSKFDQLSLQGHLMIYAGAGTTQNFEVIGGSMYEVGVTVLGGGGVIKGGTITGTNLVANGGDATCGGVGDYSQGSGFLSNITIQGTVCTIQNTSRSIVTNAAVSGGTITLTLSAPSQFFKNGMVAMSGFSAPWTCLNGQDLQVTATSGSSVSFAVGATGCTGSSAASGVALAAAFGAWSSPSWTNTNSTFQGNTVQYAPGTTLQYIQYAILEMGCSNCSVKDNIINTPDTSAFGQNYSCITDYSGGMKIEGNLCNGFGVNGNGINISAHTSYNTALAGNYSSIKNNTIVNPAAVGTSSNLSAGIAVNCNLASGSTDYTDVSGNKIYGAFWRGVAVTSTGGGTCTVSAKVEGNEIYNAANAIYAYNSTVSLGTNTYSGVTNQFVNGGSVTVKPVIIAGQLQLSNLQNAAGLGTDINGNVVASSSNQVLIGSSSFLLSTTTAGCYRLISNNTNQAFGGLIDLIEGGANGQELYITYNGGTYLPQLVSVTGDVASKNNGWITSIVVSNNGVGTPLTLDVCADAASAGTSYNQVKANFYGFGTPTASIITSPVIGATAGSNTSSVTIPPNTGGPWFTNSTNAWHQVQGVNATTGFQINGTAPNGHVLIGNGTNYVDGTIPAASATTTAATSDNVTITGMTSSGHCSVDPTNASAATNLATTYISAKAANQITLTHTATAGMTFDVVCTPY